MTRAESYTIRDEIFHERYLIERERRLAYSAKYYREHKEQIAEYNRKRRAGLLPVKEPDYIRPSTYAFEEMLPYGLKVKIQRLREEYLAIHISERPPYDYFLRCKTIEHMRQKNYERRNNKQHPTT